ncbi:MAG: hypothetical protein P1U86_10165 [Verrucomicrobiales bacterium]|nr:hypothetical protein [Verrucomicrobiales bacterium]
MSFRLFSASIFSLWVFCQASIVIAAPTETAERLAQAEADLDKARESLHVAHQELGEKTEKINRLERLLEKSPGARRKKEGSGKEVGQLKRDLQAANARIRELETKIKRDADAAKKREVAKKAEARKAELKKVEAQMAEAKRIGEADLSDAAEAPEIFRVNYEVNSAANLEGRELALKWIQGKLKKNSGARFEIRGQANDTAFKEANRAIAENRANFLASFLRVGGVPADSLVEVSGEGVASAGAAGRIVEVFLLP